MASGYGAKVALDKKMKREAAASYRLAEDLKRAPVRGRRREVKERASTAARRERKAIYGKYDPANGISECCSMIRAANGACTGCE